MEIEVIEMPGINFPSWRVNRAAKAGVIKNILFVCWGGMGDQICCEPTIREIFQRYSMCDISIATDFPELFSNLPFKKIYDLQKERPVWADYFCLYGQCNPSTLVWQFLQHGEMNGVDFSSVMALRAILPHNEKDLRFNYDIPSDSMARKVVASRDLGARYVAIHAGRTWETRTFPKDWYDEIASLCFGQKLFPILIGGDCHGKGTVDVDARITIDLRGKLSIQETCWLLQRIPLITNDSAPMHMAASGSQKIAFLATARKSDYIAHWRKNEHGTNEWMYNMKDFARGGIWQHLDHTPGSQKIQGLDKIDEETLRTWLPAPKEIVDWILL